MNNILRKTDALLIRAKFKWDEFWNHEEGDTNFISILVLLGIALGLAGIFMGFQDSIMDWVDSTIGNFFSDTLTDTTKTFPGGSSGGGFR